MKNKKLISIFELSLVILSVIAFSYFVSTNLPEVLQHPGESKVLQFLTKPIIPIVSANSNVPTGCCKETTGGAICQNMVLGDASACKTDLIGTGCQVVKECQTGCCYDLDSGMCTLNAPQEKCLSNGGLWDVSTTCNIPECQVGCCVLGDGASMMTTRECTQASNQYRLVKDFRPLDIRGSCDAYSDLSSEGACLTDSGDFSGMKSCVFTTKDKCLNSGSEFKRDYLCTSDELNTVCEKTEKTTCIDGKDQVYFIDSCGNKANVYDSTKADDPSYWEKVIPASQSCSGNPTTCGNCEYSTGSICTRYYSGKDMPKPATGDYVCRNLNCANGKEHGESWCITDYNSNKTASAAVGTRSYVARCFEGEIILEGCADFNQEVCISNGDASHSEAKCEVNDWRACIVANDKDNYQQIKHACDVLPQCIMFTDIPGNEIYRGLPGFREVSANDQARAGPVGDGMNKLIAQCVPKYTPGFQFWTSSSVSNSFSKTTGTNIESNANYGGSKTETDALCGLASFTCVSHIAIDTPLVNPSPSDKENPECNIQSVGANAVPLMMQAANERCRAIGSCGMQYNVQGQLGNAGFNVIRTFIDKDGKAHENYSTLGYNFPIDYINKTLKETQATTKMGEITTLTQITKMNGGSALIYKLISTLITGFATTDTESLQQTTQQARAGVGYYAGGADDTQSMMQIEQGVGALAGAGYSAGLGNLYTVAGTNIVSTSSSGAASAWTAANPNFVGPPNVVSVNAFAMIGVTMVASLLGSYIGGMLAKSMGLSPGETTAFVGAFSQFTAGLAYVGMWIYYGASICAGVVTCIIGLVVIVVMMVYSLFTGEDHEYYLTRFECSAWEPPLNGNCDVCNNDVRPCSEDKCRSLGNNCHYFVDNGEPGYCASLAQVWSAVITPWNETITSGNVYTNVSSAGFKIQDKSNPDYAVDAWKELKFGIITNKQAICKIGLNHSASFDSMQYTMLSDVDYTTGKVDGMHHKIVLSPNVVMSGSELDQGSTTPPIHEGDNEYYIKCRNFAGQENDAPFIVQVKQMPGPDLSAAIITRFSPAEKAYIAYGNSSTQFWLYLNEPAECRYSIDYDQNYYSDMPYNFSCLTNPNQAFYGEWPCMAYLNNITEDTNLFIKCKDQPNLNESGLVTRNVNSISEQYPVKVCKTGLAISSVKPSTTVILNETKEVDLEVTTTGCVEGGKATCYYKLSEYGSQYSMFFQTGNTIHKQPLTTLGNGIHPLNIQCQDIAGNMVNYDTNITVLIDNSAPMVTRAYIDGSSLVLKTNEDAECLANKNNITIGCDFGYESATGQYFTTHTMALSGKGGDIFYVKCRDRFGNAPISECTQIIKTNEIQ